MKYCIFFLVAFFSFSQTLHAEDKIVVLSGLPLTQCNSTFQESTNHQLSDGQSYKYRLLIVKRDGGYYWESRNSKPLVLKTSGIFSIFIEPGGAGYIKVSTADDKVLYKEHLSLGLQTVTYWGDAASFNP